jgi:hypothetical protein
MSAHGREGVKSIRFCFVDRCPCLAGAACRGHPDPRQAAGDIIVRVHVGSLWGGYGDGVHETRMRKVPCCWQQIAERRQQRPAPSCFFQWPRNTARLFRMSCQDPVQPILVAFWRVSTGQVTKEFFYQLPVDLNLCLLIHDCDGCC